MKPKAQTMAQKFGFMDADLTTPKHDAIMLWLDETITKVNTEKVYGNYPNYQWSWSQFGKHQWEEEENRRIVKQLTADGKIVIDPDTPVRVILRKDWECPVLDRTYTIGFADMRVLYAFCDLSTQSVIELLAKHEDRQEEIAFPIHAKHAPNWDKRISYFEVKPSIPSLGEVIRQVRMYQTYTGDAAWWIVSPDTRFRSQIEAQGIKFLEVPSDI